MLDQSFVIIQRYCVMSSSNSRSVAYVFAFKQLVFLFKGYSNFFRTIQSLISLVVMNFVVFGDEWVL